MHAQQQTPDTEILIQLWPMADYLEVIGDRLVSYPPRTSSTNFLSSGTGSSVCPGRK